MSDLTAFGTIMFLLVYRLKLAFKRSAGSNLFIYHLNFIQTKTIQKAQFRNGFFPSKSVNPTLNYKN